jgi:hypothetical protein
MMCLRGVDVPDLSVTRFCSNLDLYLWYMQVASLKQVSANLKEDLRARRAEMDAWASKVEMAKRVFE